MPEHPTGEPEPVDAAISRVQDQGEHLTTRIARLAGSIAESEDGVARTYEESARLRPHAAERLRRAADEARRFARHERDQAARLRGNDGPEDARDED